MTKLIRVKWFFQIVEAPNNNQCPCGCGGYINVMRKRKYASPACSIHMGVLPFLGKHHNQKTRDVLRQLATGRRGRKDPRKGKTAEEFYGKERAEQIGRKISVAGKGRPKPADFGKRISIALTGKPKSETARANMSVSAKERDWSEYIPWNRDKTIAVDPRLDYERNYPEHVTLSEEGRKSMIKHGRRIAAMQFPCKYNCGGTYTLSTFLAHMRDFHTALFMESQIKKMNKMGTFLYHDDHFHRSRPELKRCIELQHLFDLGWLHASVSFKTLEIDWIVADPKIFDKKNPSTWFKIIEYHQVRYWNGEKKEDYEKNRLEKIRSLGISCLVEIECVL